MTARTLSIALSLAAFAGAAAAAPEAQMPGSDAPKAVAEARHLPKVHGFNLAAVQPVAQAAGSAIAQDRAEATHLAKDHGTVNDAADRYTLQAASKL